MKATYKIMEETNGERKATGFTSTRKREIMATFNRFMRNLKKDSRYSVEDIRIGYSMATFYGTYGHITTEYWIAKD